MWELDGVDDLTDELVGCGDELARYAGACFGFVVVVVSMVNLGEHDELNELENVDAVEQEVEVDLIEFGVYELNWLFKLELLSLDEVTNESGDIAVCLRCSSWPMSCTVLASGRLSWSPGEQTKL